MEQCNGKKIVLITGASSGIGQAMAIAVGGAGYHVIVHYGRNLDGAKNTLHQLQEAGGTGEILSFDINNRRECFQELEKINDKYGALWGLINNAGICSDGAFPALSEKDWDTVIHTNLDSFFNVIQPLVMPMCSKRRGRIITIASVSGIMGNRGQVNYSAAKAGIIGATKALAVELASRSITVNCIAPGLIETDMIKDAPMEMILPTIPMGRVGKPEEVAALALFLLSDAASYITRQVISVNGGLT
ncbi:MAG: 3-oxoacyl-ACP reductase FabG [Spirochaetaceae bacterium]|nr:3-oxoacyl-ACP reductase FabG [Spirochaetaceae bacterium]